MREQFVILYKYIYQKFINFADWRLLCTEWSHREPRETDIISVLSHHERNCQKEKEIIGRVVEQNITIWQSHALCETRTITVFVINHLTVGGARQSAISKSLIKLTLRLNRQTSITEVNIIISSIFWESSGRRN